MSNLMTCVIESSFKKKFIDNFNGNRIFLFEISQKYHFKAQKSFMKIHNLFKVWRLILLCDFQMANEASHDHPWRFVLRGQRV